MRLEKHHMRQLSTAFSEHFLIRLDLQTPIAKVMIAAPVTRFLKMNGRRARMRAAVAR